MGFSRQEYWSGLPCPPPGDLPDPGSMPGFPALQTDSLPSDPPGSCAVSCALGLLFYSSDSSSFSLAWLLGSSEPNMFHIAGIDFVHIVCASSYWLLAYILILVLSWLHFSQ